MKIKFTEQNVLNYFRSWFFKKKLMQLALINMSREIIQATTIFLWYKSSFLPIYIFIKQVFCCLCFSQVYILHTFIFFVQINFIILFSYFSIISNQKKLNLEIREQRNYTELVFNMNMTLFMRILQVNVKLFLERCVTNVWCNEGKIILNYYSPACTGKMSKLCNIRIFSSTHTLKHPHLHWKHAVVMTSSSHNSCIVIVAM